MWWLSKILALSLIFGLVTISYAADNVNLLIMIDDSDKDSIHRDTHINARVQASISQQLNHIANVYDETSVNLNSIRHGHERLADAELLDIARSINRPPIDILAVLSTYAEINTTEYAKKAQVRIEGRLLNAKSGQFLDNFEVQSPRSWSIPHACVTQTCMFEDIGNEAKLLGDELGVVLAEKLNWLVNGQETDNRPNSTVTMFNDYYLEFDGFSANDVASIEEYLLVFSGYVSHRPTQQRYTRTTLLYRSTTSTAMLSRNILKVLEELNMRASVNFEGNLYSVKRITLRGENLSRDVADGW